MKRNSFLAIANISKILLCIIVLLTTSCSDITAPSTEGKIGAQELSNSDFKKGASKYSNLEFVRKAEGSFIELSKQIPGFGGFYRTREGNLIIYAKDISSPQSVKQNVLSYINNESRYPTAVSLSQATLKQSLYSYSELSGWRDIIRGPIFSINGITKLDLAEHINRLTIGVENTSFVESVEKAVSNTEVPLEAVNIEITGKLRSLKASAPKKLLSTTTLEDKFRPVTGGIEIDSDDTGHCTMSFAALWESKEVFLTNSHCTGIFWGVDSNTEFYQPDATESSNIGTEVHDPAGWTSGCPKDECRASDAAIVELDGVADGDIGTIAKTEGRGVDWTPGSKEIDDSMPRFRIISDDKEIMFNMPLNKMGFASGWTNGWVTETCSDLPGVAPDTAVLCSTVVEKMFAQSGDSGSPVFYDQTTPSGDVELVGILWGIYGATEESVFSAMENVYFDLGSMIATDPPIEVNISGLSFIDETGQYQWTANVDDQEGSVSYQWSIKWEGSSSWSNLGTSSSQSVTVSNNDDFTLKVEVSDDLDSDVAQRSVTVELECTPSNPCN